MGISLASLGRLDIAIAAIIGRSGRERRCLGLRKNPPPILSAGRNGLETGDASLRSSGRVRAESAVEPTSSDNISVSWRRSAVSRRFGSVLVSATAAKIFRRCLDSGAKCNRAMQTGFARLCQAL